MQTRDRSDILDYWQGVYAAPAQGGIPALPSQFAAFAAGEAPPGALVVDVGCGNGRDSFLFARHGHRVIGVDASSAAIAECKKTQRVNGLGVIFLCADVCDGNLVEQLRLQFPLELVSHILVYSRFLLHAVPESGQSALFALTLALGTSTPTRLAVEFRTVRDAGLPKLATSHFRRFIDPLSVVMQATNLGLKTEYFVEGFGFAKFGVEDAHVARCIFSK